jgi:hypothetical protein
MGHFWLSSSATNKQRQFWGEPPWILHCPCLSILRDMYSWTPPLPGKCVRWGNSTGYPGQPVHI